MLGRAQEEPEEEHARAARQGGHAQQGGNAGQVQQVPAEQAGQDAAQRRGHGEPGLPLHPPVLGDGLVDVVDGGNYICIQYDFSTFVYARSIVRMEMLLVAMIFLALFIHMSALQVITNIGVYLITASIVGALAYSILHLYDAVWWTIACMILCVVLYVVILYFIPSERTIITSGIDKLLSKVRRS